MSVISPTRTELPTEAALHQLPLATQDTFEHLWARAEQEADHRNLTAYALLHAQAATLIGIRHPARGELARCTCPCYCDTVFDAMNARTYLDGHTERVQCPGCADDHLRTGDE
ncbi:hypothetical protein [Streptomyces sp. NPDC059076]|uniref:hypothetical protein n=1 Tax=unclassified Streptomyces TaxID=2593676 RepID=UPI00369ADB08